MTNVLKKFQTGIQRVNANRNTTGGERKFDLLGVLTKTKTSRPRPGPLSELKPVPPPPRHQAPKTHYGAMLDSVVQGSVLAAAPVHQQQESHQPEARPQRGRFGALTKLTQRVAASGLGIGHGGMPKAETENLQTPGKTPAQQRRESRRATRFSEQPQNVHPGLNRDELLQDKKSLENRLAVALAVDHRLQQSMQSLRDRLAEKSQQLTGDDQAWTSTVLTTRACLVRKQASDERLQANEKILQNRPANARASEQAAVDRQKEMCATAERRYSNAQDSEHRAKITLDKAQRNVDEIGAELSKLRVLVNNSAATIDQARKSLRELQPRLETSRTQADAELQVRIRQQIATPVGFSAGTNELHNAMQELANRLQTPPPGLNETQQAQWRQLRATKIPVDQVMSMVSDALASACAGDAQRAIEVLNAVSSQPLDQRIAALNPRPESPQEQAESQFLQRILALTGGMQTLSRLVPGIDGAAPTPALLEAAEVAYRAQKALTPRPSHAPSADMLEQALSAAKKIALPSAANPLSDTERWHFSAVRQGYVDANPSHTTSPYQTALQHLEDWRQQLLSPPESASARKPKPLFSLPLSKADKLASIAAADTRQPGPQTKYNQDVVALCDLLLKPLDQEVQSRRQALGRGRGGARQAPAQHGLRDDLQQLLTVREAVEQIKMRATHNQLRDNTLLTNIGLKKKSEKFARQQYKLQDGAPGHPPTGDLKAMMDHLGQVLPQAGPTEPIPAPDRTVFNALNNLWARSNEDNSSSVLQLLQALNLALPAAASRELAIAVVEQHAKTMRVNDGRQPGATEQERRAALVESQVSPLGQNTFGSLARTHKREVGIGVNANAGVLGATLDLAQATGAVTIRPELEVKGQQAVTAELSRKKRHVTYTLQNSSELKGSAGGSILAGSKGGPVQGYGMATHRHQWGKARGQGVVVQVPVNQLGNTHVTATQSMADVMHTVMNHNPDGDYKDLLQEVLHKHPEVSISALQQVSYTHETTSELKGVLGAGVGLDGHTDGSSSPVKAGLFATAGIKLKRLSKHSKVNTEGGLQGEHAAKKTRTAETNGVAGVTAGFASVNANNTVPDKMGPLSGNLFGLGGEIFGYTMTVGSDMTVTRQPDGNLEVDSKKTYATFESFKEAMDADKDAWLMAQMASGEARSMWPQGASIDQKWIDVNHQYDQFMAQCQVAGKAGNVSFVLLKDGTPQTNAWLTGHMAQIELAAQQGRQGAESHLRAEMKIYLEHPASMQVFAGLLFANSGIEKSKGLALPFLSVGKSKVGGASHAIAYYGVPHLPNGAETNFTYIQARPLTENQNQPIN